MSSPNYDSRTADKFVVRLPDGLRADIEAAATADDRSMNSVFVKAVRQFLDGQRRQQVLLDVLANTVTAPVRPVPFNIDERVTMAADARRYRHLRDKARIEDADNDLLVLRGDRYLTGEELDREIDNALRLARLLELHPCAD